MMKYMSGMLDTILAAKMKAEKKLQDVGARWAAHTARVQKEIDSGKRRVDG